MVTGDVPHYRKLARMIVRKARAGNAFLAKEWAKTTLRTPNSFIPDERGDRTDRAELSHTLRLLIDDDLIWMEYRRLVEQARACLNGGNLRGAADKLDEAAGWLGELSFRPNRVKVYIERARQRSAKLHRVAHEVDPLLTRIRAALITAAKASLNGSLDVQEALSRACPGTDMTLFASLIKDGIPEFYPDEN